MEPVLSVILPVYNAEDFIENCIDSLLQQDYPNLQIIAVDDGSRDHTRQILEQYEAADSRIQMLYQENGGVSKARNTGMKAAKGEWILFVDADDTVSPDYCSRFMTAAMENTADILLQGPFSREAAEDEICPGNAKELILSCLSYDEHFPFNVDAVWGKLFRTSFLRKHRIWFSEELSRSEDALFCIHAYEKAGKIVILNRGGYLHAQRDGSLCRAFDPDAPAMLERILRKNSEWVRSCHPEQEAYQKALWHRVMPGIVECETNCFLHPENKMSDAENTKAYRAFLNQPMVKKAIRSLKLSDVQSRQYRLRLIFYKLRLGGVFWLLKKHRS